LGHILGHPNNQMLHCSWSDAILFIWSGGLASGWDIVSGRALHTCVALVSASHPMPRVLHPALAPALAFVAGTRAPHWKTLGWPTAAPTATGHAVQHPNLLVQHPDKTFATYVYNRWNI
jgi:hypothetical protein